MTINHTRHCSECDKVDEDLELCPTCEVGCYDKVTDNECCTGCWKCTECGKWTHYKDVCADFDIGKRMCNKCSEKK